MNGSLWSLIPSQELTQFSTVKVGERAAVCKVSCTCTCIPCMNNGGGCYQSIPGKSTRVATSSAKHWFFLFFLFHLGFLPHFLCACAGISGFHSWDALQGSSTVRAKTKGFPADQWAQGKPRVGWSGPLFPLSYLRHQNRPVTAARQIRHTKRHCLLYFCFSFFNYFNSVWLHTLVSIQTIRC